jgi:hypothetical protein
MIVNIIICHLSGQSCNMEDIQKHILSCKSCKKLAKKKKITIHTPIKAMSFLIPVSRSWFRATLIYEYYKCVSNKMQHLAVYILFHCRIPLYVSGALCSHHQEF